MITRKYKESQELTKYFLIFYIQYSRTSRTSPQKGKLKHPAAWQILDFTALISKLRTYNSQILCLKLTKMNWLNHQTAQLTNTRVEYGIKNTLCLKGRKFQINLREKPIITSVKTFVKVSEIIPVCLQPVQVTLLLNHFILV